MFRWRFIKQFPKIALVLGVFVISTGLFGFWWYFKRPQIHRGAVVTEDTAKAKVAELADTIPSMVGNLLVVDGDLYQLDSGKLLQKSWLKEAMPMELFLDAESKKLIARYDKGLARFTLDGNRDAVISERYGLAINDQLDFVTYAKDKDVWKAAIDFREFKLVQEQRVTTTAGFMEQFFTDNIILGTDKVLIVRNMNQLLRVNLITGEVTSTRIPLTGLRNQRSPDDGLLVGVSNERRLQRFFAYNLEEDEAKYFDLEPRVRVTAFAWANKNTCAFLISGVGLSVYNREKQEIVHVARLPFQAGEMVNPSPSGRYIFCANFTEQVLVDIEQKQIVTLEPLAQCYAWIADDVLLCARDVPDTNLRGTWLKQIGKEEVRVSMEPYTFARRGVESSVKAIKEAGVVFFSTRDGIFKVELGDARAQMFAPLSKPLTRFVYIEKWKR